MIIDLDSVAKELLKILKKYTVAELDVRYWGPHQIRNIGYKLNKHGYEINWNQQLVDGELRKDYSTILIGKKQ